jgi:hypothetical protein
VHIGYTEILSELTHTKKAITMFDTMGLKIFFHTRHLSLRQACDAVTKESLLETIATCDRITKSSPAFDRSLSLAVAGLNPHSGEHGLFGDEEMVSVEPAVIEARRQGIDVVGPIGADSVFYQTRMGKYRAGDFPLSRPRPHAAKTYDFTGPSPSPGTFLSTYTASTMGRPSILPEKVWLTQAGWSGRSKLRPPIPEAKRSTYESSEQGSDCCLDGDFLHLLRHFHYGKAFGSR